MAKAREHYLKVRKVLDDQRSFLIAELNASLEIIELIEQKEDSESVFYYKASLESLVENDEYSGEFGWSDFPSYECEEVAACLNDLQEIAHARRALEELMNFSTKLEALHYARDFKLGRV